MSNNSTKTPYGKFKNANAYSHLAVVVVGFEAVKVNGVNQIYATGFNLERPEEKVAVALMSEMGFRKNLAQVHCRLTEKHDNGEVAYFDTGLKKEITKEDYYNRLNNDERICSKYSSLMDQRKAADTLLTKRARINSLPVVLMFDNANKLETMGGVNVYEARWVSGISGNTPKHDMLYANEEDDKIENSFAVAHREVLGNVHIKYDQDGKPYWGDLNAVDRVCNLEAPRHTQNMDEKITTAIYNRDILCRALSNELTSDEYSVERKPFSYFLLIDSKDQSYKETVRLINEEYKSSRVNDGDHTQKHVFMRPKDAPATIEAYLNHQDAQTIGFTTHLKDNQYIDADHSHLVESVFKADKCRAIISALMLQPFTPVITTELAERGQSKSIASDIAIKANTLTSIHRKLVQGELQPRLVNGTTYPIGKAYLDRFVGDLQPTQTSRIKPIKGIVDTVPFPKDMAGDLKHKHRIMGFTQVDGNDGKKENLLIFSKLYICPTKYDKTSKQSSLFVGLITTKAQSFDEAYKGRLLHTQLNETHSPAPSSYRLIAVEYADYAEGKKPAPSVKLEIEERVKHIEALESNGKMEEALPLWRGLGVHKVVADTPKAEPEPAIKAKSDLIKKYSTEMDI